MYMYMIVKRFGNLTIAELPPPTPFEECFFFFFFFRMELIVSLMYEQMKLMAVDLSMVRSSLVILYTIVFPRVVARVVESIC